MNSRVSSRRTALVAGLAMVLASVFAAAAFAASVEVLSPSAGSELSGAAKVVARVVVQPGERLDQVMLQTSRGEALRMAPEFADTYQVTLDTTALRNGRQALLVIAYATPRRFRGNGAVKTGHLVLGLTAMVVGVVALIIGIELLP